ncbi:unnamed protein product, partial [Laminaria digitata]
GNYCTHSYDLLSRVLERVLQVRTLCVHLPVLFTFRSYRMMASSSPTAPTVPAPDYHTVTFSSKDVPITAVTVFCEDKAEVTRVVNFSPSSGIGPYEVELTELPDRSMIDQASVRVKGSGYCTIVHVSYSARTKMVTKPAPTEEEEKAAKAKKEGIEQELQQLSDDHIVLGRQFTRNQRMRQLADSFAQRVVV